MNIFLAPRSNETSHENFGSTILDGRAYSEIEPFLTDQEKLTLSPYPTLRVWGTKESLRGRWRKMETGDYALFYAEGSFNYSARVVLTKFSPELGAKLWKLDKNGESWPCLFFLDSVTEIKIPIGVVRELARYKPSWKTLRGFMMLNKKALPVIISEYGSIESFVGQEKHEAAIEENVWVIAPPDRTYEIENKTQLLRDAADFKSDAPGYRIDTTPRKVRIESRTQKRLVARLENFSCQICGWSLGWNSNGVEKHYIEIDHILDKARGGTEANENLWALCPNCHTKKTLGVITFDSNRKTVRENGAEITLHHDERGLF